MYEKLPKIINPIGDAAALGRYGDYPVDKSTGVPSIRIPLFKIQVNEFELPVDLSYHAGGNKVDDVSSVVGLGWSLNAGGCITRSVRGKPDEYGSPYSHPYARNYKTRDEIDYGRTLRERMCELHDLQTFHDLESDLYTFNFNGHSGQFMYNSDNQLVLSSYEDLKITGDPIAGFTIYTADGTRYIFDDGDTFITNVINSFKSNWYLKQIITPNGDIIDFSYNHLPYLLQMDHQISFLCQINTTAISNWKYVDYVDIQNLTYLSAITFKNGSANFTYSMDREDVRPHRLTSMVLSNSDGKIIKKINLGQSYFLSQWGNPAIPLEYKYYHRLKLDNVDVVNPDNSADIQRYSFVYNTTSLPPYFYEQSITPNSYYSQDYWGYFNNKANTHLIPVMNACALSAADRSVDEEAMQATILKKIIFPTGGRTEFIYAANTVTSSDQNGPKLGGLRIMKILNFSDGQTQEESLVKSYNYVSGGVTTNWCGPGRDVTQFLKWFYFNLANGITGNYSSNPIGQVAFSSGVTCLYPQVIEYSGENEELKSEYYYNVTQEIPYTVNSNLNNCFSSPYMLIYPSGFSGPQLEHHMFTMYFKDNSWRSGQLTRQIDYKKEGESYSPVSETVNTWSDYKAQDNIVGIKLIELGPYELNCPDSDMPDCTYQYFNILWESGVKKLTKTLQLTYTPVGSVTKTIDYEYSGFALPEPHGNVTKEILTNSDGEKSWKEYHYLQDLFPSPSGVYAIMKSQNMLGSPLEVITGRFKNNTNYFLGSEVYNFGLFANIPKISFIKKLNLSIPSSSYTNWTDSRLDTELSLDSYDLNGNLLNATTKDDTPVGYQWGYNNTYPVAKVKNAKNYIEYNIEPVMNQLVFPANANQNDQIEQNADFTTDAVGTISFNLTFGGAASGQANFTFWLTGPSNVTYTLCLSSGNGCTNPSSYSSEGMPAGNYHLRVISNNMPIGSTNQNFQYHYLQRNISYLTKVVEFYYQGFEEYVGATLSTETNPSHAGKYYYSGDFLVPFAIPNARSYVVEYNYWNGNKWISMRKPYTQFMVLSEGSAIDEVRVYPSDALMTTFTYDPLIGMTSSTDENNVTTYYEYDSFGRLNCIKDQNKDIVKSYQYHYQNELIIP